MHASVAEAEACRHPEFTGRMRLPPLGFLLRTGRVFQRGRPPAKGADEDGPCLFLSGGTGNDTLYLGDVEITPATASGTGAASRSVTVYPYPGARVVTTQTRAAGATTWVTGASTRLTMHRDTLKSVSAESFASGTNINTLARRTLYAPYGETLSQAAWNNAPADSKGWIGERAEPDSGLIYLNARWYDPALSRFTRPDKLDPIIPGVGPDQYGYAGGDPVNNSDPGGENPVAGGAIGAVAGAAGRAIRDLWEGKLSSFEDYAKATAEGALVGAAVGSGGAVLGAAVGGAIAVGDALVEGRVPTLGEFIAGAAGGGLAGFGSSIGGKAVAAGATSAVAGAALKGEVAQVAKGEIPLVDALSRAAAVFDRSGLTVAGRALQKHGSRKGSAFPAAKGNPSSINAQGQRVVDGILNNPSSTTITRNHARFGEVIEVRAPDGRGVRYSIDGNFIGFLEP